jgi:hypothetical protein
MRRREYKLKYPAGFFVDLKAERYRSLGGLGSADPVTAVELYGRALQA